MLMCKRQQIKTIYVYLCGLTNSHYLDTFICHRNDVSKIITWSPFGLWQSRSTMCCQQRSFRTIGCFHSYVFIVLVECFLLSKWNLPAFLNDVGKRELKSRPNKKKVVFILQRSFVQSERRHRQANIANQMLLCHEQNKPLRRMIEPLWKVNDSVFKINQPIT